MEKLESSGACLDSANKFSFYITIVTTFLTGICILGADIAYIITGSNLYQSTQRRFLYIYLCCFTEMMTANLYIILYIFEDKVPFWIQEFSMTNYMFWFYLSQWVFIFEHYKTSVYIEKRLQLSEKELETHSVTDLKHWEKTNLVYCSLLILSSVATVFVQYHSHNKYWG